MIEATKRHLPWLALALVGIAAQLAWMDATVGTYDEGLVLVGADRVLRGELPYRDFWTLYGPGSFFVLAGLYGLFGELALVERGFDIASKTVIAALVFAVVLRFGRRSIALAAGVLSLGLLLYLRSYSAPLFPAMACSLIVVLALHRVAIEPRPAPAFLAGFAIGVTTWFRHDLGAYALLAAVLFLAELVWAADPRARRAALQAAAWLLAGLAASLGPVVAFFLASVPPAELYRDLVAIPLWVYPGVRALPFPSPSEALTEALQARSMGRLGPLVVYLPPLVLGAGLLAELRRASNPPWKGPAPADLRAEAPAQTRLFRLLLLLGALFFFKGLVRVSPLHMGASLIVSSIVLGAGIARARSPAWRNGLTLAGGLACVALLAKPLITGADRATGGGPSAAALLSDRWMLQARALCREPVVPRLRCLRLQPDASAVAAYLAQQGVAGRRVYVGLGRHDKIFAANLTLMFAIAALPPTRWHDLHPGVQTRADIQAQMLRELQAAPLAYVVLDAQWDGVAEPNESAVSSGVTALDDYLAAHFEPVFRAGSLSVLQPRSGPPV